MAQARGIIGMCVLMFVAWFVLVVTGTVSLAWYEKVLARKLPYTAGLRQLEERRAAQQKVSAWQERMRDLQQLGGPPPGMGR